MFKLNGTEYSLEEVTSAAESSNLSVDEYVNEFGLETVEVTDETQTTPNEGKTNGAVETDAAVAPVTTPSRASMIVDAQPESTESDSVDISLESQPRRSIRAQGRQNQIEKNKENKKQEARLATKEIQTAQENIPQKDIQSQQANIYFDLPSIAPRDKMDYVYQGAYGMGQSSKPMFESDEDYTTYLKDKLGDKYNQYLEFNKTGSITPNGTQENEDELRSLQVDARNQISAKISNDMLYNVPEDVQQYMTSSPVFASGNTLEEQKFAIDELANNIGQMRVNYAEGVKAYNENAVPLIDEIKSIDNTIKDLGGTNEGLQFYEAGQVGGLDSPKRIQQYNDLIEQRNSLLNQYNEGGFNVLYDGLISQERVINQEAENYINLVNTSRNKIVDSELLKEAISKDYSASARVGRSFDEFFLQSGRNVLDLSTEIGLEAFKFALKPEYRPAIDDVINVVQQNNKNYNLEMDAKRKQLPTAPTLDDIGENNIGFFDWFSVAMQDNSPTIATTFIPGGLAAKGAAGVKAAFKTGSYAAKKAALQNQKKLWLAGKRTLQTAFFVAETGGQYGRLQTEEGDREQQISLLQSQLNDTESLEDRTKIYNKIEELKSVEDYSLFQKAFTSFGYGTTATLAETFGTLKLIQGGKALAKNIGTQAAKKEFYSKPSTFAAGIISKAVPGLSPLVKGVAVEEMEETLTQVSHNMFDVFVLGEDKNLIDGLDKDFFANVAVTSFGIMSPKTTGNVVNIIKNEFRTKQEVVDNQNLAVELIELNEAIPASTEDAKVIRERKRNILEELALNDAVSLHKLRYMTPVQIEEVADLNRQKRKLKEQMFSLGRTGERSKVQEQKQAEINKELSAIERKQQEILNSKERANRQKAKQVSEELGDSFANADAAYWYGFNDFYNEIAMAQMGDGDFISATAEVNNELGIPILDYKNLDEELKKYNETDKAAIKLGLLGEINPETGEVIQPAVYAMQIGKDIIINQPLIDQQIGLAPTSGGAKYAALAPLEELFHLNNKGKKMKFDGDAKLAVDEAIKVLENKLELGEISQENFNDLTERFKLYKDGETFDVEELIAQMNNAVALGDIKLSDISSTPSLKSFLNGAIRNVFGDQSWMLNLKTSDDVFNFIKNFQADIQGQVSLQLPDEDDSTIKASKIYQEIETFKDDLINDQTKSSTAFLIADKLENEVDRRLKIDVDPETKEDIVRNFLFDDKRGLLGLLQKYDPARNESIMGYLNSTTPGGKLLDARLIEFYENDPRYNQIIQSITDEAVQRKAERVTSEDITETTAEDVTDKPLAKKPTETVVYSDEILSNVNAANVEVLENRITEEIQTAFEGKDISRFKELKDIPENITQLYADMFELSTVDGIVDFKRNFPKLDEDAVRKIRTFLNRNAEDDFRRLPKTKDDKKKATGIKQTKLGKVMYDANDNLVGTLKQYKDILQGKNITLPAYNGEMIEFNRLDKTGKKLPLYRDSQHYKAALKFHIQNRIAEDVMPDKAQRLSAGLKFSKQGLLDVTQARDINAVLKIVGMDSASVPDSKRADIQKAFEDAIKKHKLTTNVFLAGAFAFSGAKYKRKADGNVYYELTNGEEIIGVARRDSEGKIRRNKNGKKLFDQPTAEQIVKQFGEGVKLLPGKGRLYYGVNDPAYQTALAEAKKNSEGKNEGKAIRVNINAVDTDKGKAQAKINMQVLDDVVSQLDTAIKNGMPKELAAMVIAQGYQATTGLVKIAAPFRYFSKNLQYGTSAKQRTGDKFREEHNPPASVVGASIIYGFATNNTSEIMADIKNNYYQTKLSKADDQKLDEAKLDATLPVGTTIADNPAIRFIEAGIDLNSIVNYETGQTMAEELGVALKPSDVNVDTVFDQNQILKTVLDGAITAKEGQNLLNEIAKLKSIPKAGIGNNNENNTIKFSKQVPNQEILDNLGNADQAMANARNPEAPVKKIRVFDFDDTLARSNSNVLYEMPDGTEGSLNATQFAERAGELEAQGATFDFSEFSKVVDGKKGPVFKAIENIVAKRGAEDVFILTARPASAAGPIKEFMDALGVNLPIENIVGLGDGKAEAKARWMTGKAAEGYNDFFFVDDAYKNVKAVQDALDVFDVKSKTQQAKIKFSKASDLDKGFNDILENKTGIASEKEYGRVKAEVAGAGKGRLNFFIPPSAEDFTGLLYATLSKGKLGDQQMAWYKTHLLNPYARAMNELSSARIAMMNDYKSLKKQLEIVPKDLRKKVPGEPFTREQAIRVYIWNKQGMDIPGISKKDQADLSKYVSDNAELQVFADRLIAIQKGDQYAGPKEGWPAGTITTDMLEGLNTTKRAKYLDQWQQNADVIFSEKNLNKLEAAYGKPYRKALENMLQRMKTGRNRNFKGDTLTGRVTDWLTGSIGTIMFFNTRSAILQTISSINFVNFTDNNILAAGKAFANQKQYWSDFMTLMNSDFLKERRGGLRINVNEADIADMAKRGGARGVINKLLEFGFTPTQIADSFAIASGGATFYRNRIKSLKKQGMTDAEAEAQAFVDFRETAEESQQSSRPDRISMQQAGQLGRLVLAFANTPAQYARLIKKAASDLKNGRGDAKTNISKIIYYGVAQNLLFNALQQALFAFAFDEDEEDTDEQQKKYVSIANGMMDSLLRGMGLGGAVVSVGKNAIKRIIDEMEKKQPKLEKVGYELTKLSPPISAKLSRVNQAARSYQWDKKDMKEKGWSLDNPAYLASANVIAALTNIPLDRAVKKTNNVVQATSQDLETWERLALLGGWQDWEIGVDEEKPSNKPQPRKRKKRIKTEKF